MSDELQKHLRGVTRAAVEGDLEIGELGINEASTQLELIIEKIAGSAYLHFPSLERLDDYGASASGAMLIGVEDDSFASITGDTDLQTCLKSIDTALSVLPTVTDAILKDGSVNMEAAWICEDSLEVQGTFDCDGISSDGGDFPITVTGDITISGGSVGIGGAPFKRFGYGAPWLTIMSISPGINLLDTNSSNNNRYISSDAGTMEFGKSNDDGTSASTHLKIDSSGNVNISGLTASLPVFTDASKNLVSNAMTGTGSVVMSAAPNLTGSILVGSSAVESNVTTGITINQGAADDYVLAFKSSDITTGSSFLDTNTYGAVKKNIANYGGLEIVGLTDGAFSSGILIRGDQSVDASTYPTVHFYAQVNGSNPVLDGNVAFQFNNTSTSLIAVHGNGDIAYGGGDFTGIGAIACSGNIDAEGELLLGTGSGAKITLGDATEYIETAADGELTIRASDYTHMYYGSTEVLRISAQVDILTSLALGGGLLMGANSIGYAGAGQSFDSSENVYFVKSVFVTEQAAAATDVAGDGQIWVKSDTPNVLMFTNDAGTDEAISKVEGSFIATLTGCTTSPTVTAYYTIDGNIATLFIPQISATSNVNTMTITGLPEALQPDGRAFYNQVGLGIDNSSSVNDMSFQIGASGTIEFYKAGSSAGFTTSGNKGIFPLTITYKLS